MDDDSPRRGERFFPSRATGCTLDQHICNARKFHITRFASLSSRNPSFRDTIGASALTASGTLEMTSERLASYPHIAPCSRPSAPSRASRRTMSTARASVFTPTARIARASRAHRARVAKPFAATAEAPANAALRQFPDAPAKIIEHDDVLGWAQLESKLIAACATNAGDSSVNARFQAAALLGATTTYDAVNELSVVEVYTQVYEGDLTTCSTIIDVHLRILCESMIDGDWERIGNCYKKFHDLPPQLKRQSLLATSAVAEAALLFTKEEYEYMVSFLQDMYESPDATEELKAEYEVNLEMVTAIDRFIDEMQKNKDERDRS